MEYVVKRVLVQYLVDWTPLVRQAGVAWMISILQDAGETLQVRAVAADVQTALIKLLADSNETTQELAAKCLSLLFDSCDEVSREVILNELIKGLTSIKGANASASGGEMATFTELSEIANNAGQPELVYKLMELSTASAVWNTRKGMAFALGEVSRERMAKHLPKLVPTLYRYTFDPNPRISAAMKQVWSALVPEPKKALEELLQPVLRHVSEGLTDRLWRAREASCLALADMLPGRGFADVAPLLEELFARVMRVLDDVKETVRKAAMAAWRCLCSAATRLSDGATAPAAQAHAVLGIVIPLLLESGLTHNAAEVRALAARQMLKVCEGGGAHLAPHTVRLVPALLENLSVLEDQALNYLQMHSESAGVSEAAMESARLAATRNSDASGALEQLLKVMDLEQVAAVAPQLAHLLSHGTGLPTRVGTARFVMMLAQSHAPQLRPVGPRMLATLQRTLLAERSATARRAYGSAAAVVARLVPTDSLAEGVRQLVVRYIEESGAATEEEGRLAIAMFVRELLRGAPDAMGAVRADWLPLAYCGRHEPRWQSEDKAPADEPGKLAAVWREGYDEAGISAGIAALHLPELLVLLATMVDGPSWSLRRAAAHAIVELAVAPTLQPAPKAELLRLAAALADKGRKWYDKEATLPKLEKLLPKPELTPPAAAAAPALAPAPAAAPAAPPEPASGDE